MAEVHRSFCRVCTNLCALKVEVEDGRATRVGGDLDNPLYRGYTCIKGRAQPAYLAHPDRLLHSLKRNTDDRFDRVHSGQAMDEIAARLVEIRDRHGPRAIATYTGTMTAATIGSTPVVLAALQRAMGITMRFDPNTLDKGGKQVATALLGRWMAPSQGFDDPDVILLIGTNPMSTYTGFPAGNPGRWLKEETRRGTKLIVIDPRRHQVASRAFLHLQPMPGFDVDILAAIIRIVLSEGIYDADFVSDNVRGIDTLRTHVDAFTSDVVARRAGITADDLALAARTFATARRGYAMAGTGPNMSGPGTLIEYLVGALETLCGHWLRAGERVRAVPTLLGAPAFKAQAQEPSGSWAHHVASRVRGLHRTDAGMPSASLADEILMPGEGRVRALLCLSGNPAAAFPDQIKIGKALRSLDLFVQVDPWLSQSARLAHYVIAPTMPLEVPAATFLHDLMTLRGTGYGLGASYAQYSPAVVAPPQGSDLIEEWKFLHGLGQRMGLDMKVRSFGGAPIRMDPAPTTERLIELLSTGGRVPLEEIKRHPAGTLFPEPAVRVGPKDPGWEGRFDVGNSEMMADLARVARAGPAVARGDERYLYRLICRRHGHVYNSSCHFVETHRGRAYNPAYMHSADLAALGVSKGDLVEIESQLATIVAVVEPDDGVRPGLVSMVFGFGAGPERDAAVREIGSSTNRLVADDQIFDRYTGQPRMSNVPVNVHARPMNRSLGELTQ